uniref:TM63C n=1 Tax=Poeciliopsis prolifica TaxID=188132 RepID=A0A0S7EU54_9TELE
MALQCKSISLRIAKCGKSFLKFAVLFLQVDAEQYYSELEEKCTDEFNAEKQRITMKRLGIAFVTLRDERMTAVIVKDYSCVRCRSRPQQSSITTVVQSQRWGVSYAPAPSDIIWFVAEIQNTVFHKASSCNHKLLVFYGDFM